MTFKRPAYEEVTLSYGGNIARLRPSLRAATILEDKFGLAAIDKALAEFNLNIVVEIIHAASSPQDAGAFLAGIPGKPLSPFFAAVIDPLCDLVRMFIPAPVQKQDTPKPSTGERMTFAEMFAALYDTATGFLEWSPEQAWNATPTEINRAYSAQLEKLKAIHGSGEDNKANRSTHDPEQAARNKAAGLDPEFDRDRLRALKMKIAGGRQ